MKESSIFGLVLAGGRSSRMGKDKGLIQYHDKPQREYLFELLSKFCDNVFTSCRKEQEIPPSLNPIYDKFEFESPLNGILSAFDKHSDNAWLAIAVDMPFVNKEALQFLISNRDPSKVATCFYDSDRRYPEPLVTIWEPTAFKLLKEFNRNAGISPREFLISNDCKKLISPNSQIHVNINTIGDIENPGTQ
jgi:molybdenum cofactor guanylyltransferase